MKVKLKLVSDAPDEHHRAFELIKEVFKEAKEGDTWEMAQLIEQGQSLEYITCCNNKWSVELIDGKCVFGYRGTREGFLRAQPFQYPQTLKKKLVIDPEGSNKCSIIVYEYSPSYIVPEVGQKTVEAPRTMAHLLGEFEVTEYETSTPPEWRVAPMERIVQVAEDPEMAVILAGSYPRKIVKYKNVYK